MWRSVLIYRRLGWPASERLAVHTTCIYEIVTHRGPLADSSHEASRYMRPCTQKPRCHITPQFSLLPTGNSSSHMVEWRQEDSELKISLDYRARLSFKMTCKAKVFKEYVQEDK